MSSKTETTKAKSKRTLTPRLRFPEFRNQPGWEGVPLAQIAERTTTKNLDGTVTRVLTNSAEHGILDQRDYFDKDIANAGNIDGYYIVDHGDYVYNPRISTLAPVGPISRNNIGKGVMSPLYTIFRFATENSDFFQHYFKTVCWHLYLRRVSSMGARHDRMSITTGDFMAMPVPTPPAREQEKIADCLGSLDVLIAAEGQKLAALRDHKRGLMQQLFPQPGKTQPRLRFPEFQEKGEWEQHTLGDVINISKGKGVAKADIVEGGASPCIRYAELYTIYGEVITQVRSQTNVPVDNLVLSEAGDVIIPASGETKEDIATCACVIEAGVALGSDLNVLRSDIDGRFFSYYLNGAKRSELAKFAQGDTVAHLYPSQISQLNIAVPSNEDEQQRIADCLSALDSRIDAQSAKIDTLKQHKRGLMQQLFPKPNGSES